MEENVEKTIKTLEMQMQIAGISRMRKWEITQHCLNIDLDDDDDDY